MPKVFLCRTDCINGVIWRERITVKSFNDDTLAHAFLNTGDNANKWGYRAVFPYRDASAPKQPVNKAGVYAFLGGQWHNVKSLDSSILSQI